MKIIDSIEIRNFRSIKTTGKPLRLSDLNVFVGKNDNGKSNILRALNLFFNNQTDIGQPFRFNEDYCYHANSGKGSKREISITVYVEPPKNRFKNAKTVRWSKRYKMDDSIIEDRTYSASLQPLTTSDNISKWLDKLKYRYVPAIKGKEYFNTLMGELHDALNEAHASLMSSQGQGFISGIQKVTKDITSELSNQIGIPSTIQVPSDFRQLFSNLDFGATIDNKVYHLKQRGDGIKIRHIPVILKYMAEQEKAISISGYVKPDTIWGFEEPENNLELGYAFELASTMKAYAADIQILITTHSPAFYSLDSNASIDVNKYLIQKNDALCSYIDPIGALQQEEVHEKMGLLPLITPYLEQLHKAQKNMEHLEQELAKISAKSKYCVITEDSITKNLQVLLTANGFKTEDIEFFSYDGKGQVKGAIILGKYLKKKNPEICAIIHRDRDYLSDIEIQDLREKITKSGLQFFYTTGTDIESYFLSEKHLAEIIPNAVDGLFAEALADATATARQDSIDRFIDHVLQQRRPDNGGYAKEISKITLEYDSNPERFRYGKKVLGLLKSRLHQAGYGGFDIEVPSSALQVPMLGKLAEKT